MKAREEIADALYMLRAGSDPDIFLRTLRAYVLQHTTTTEQALELLRDLASVNPPAFAEAQQMLRAQEQVGETLHAIENIQRKNATLQERLATQPAASGHPKKLSKRGARARTRDTRLGNL